MRSAVIGIGSNSVRALLGETDGDAVRRLWLSTACIRKTAEAVGRMAAEARRRGAERVDIFATSAARDAANGPELISEIEKAAGAAPEIITGEEEARLSFMGASLAAPISGRCGVIDIGGGSTEIVTGEGGDIDCAFSCQMGAVRLFQSIQLESRDDMGIAEKAAMEILREKMAETGSFRAPECWVGTGGTFTTLAAMVKQIPWTNRTSMHGTRVSLREIRTIGEQLADMDLETRKRLPGLQPGRADIVVHGICILLAVMNQLDIPEITVSEWGNLDGYLRRKLNEGKEQTESLCWN